MPIYEYNCKRCGTDFETLVRASSPAVECPNCHGGDLTKKLSAFAAPSNSGADRSDLPGPCGSCGHPDGPGSCAFR